MSQQSSKANYEGANPPQIAGKVYRLVALINNLRSRFHSIED